MNDETENNKLKRSPKPIRIVDVKPAEILLRKRYDLESAKEYKYFLEKLGQYEVDVELYKTFLDNEEYKKKHGEDKPTGKQYVSFQAPIEIFKAFKDKAVENDCTQVSAFINFMDQYGKGKQVKFADQIKNLETEVKKLKKELENKNIANAVKNTSLVAECSCDKTELERVRSELVEAKNKLQQPQSAISNEEKLRLTALEGIFQGQIKALEEGQIVSREDAIEAIMNDRLVIQICK